MGFSSVSLSPLPLSPHGLSEVTTSFGMDSTQGDPRPSVCLNQLLISSFVILLFLHRKAGFSRDTNEFVAQVAVENFAWPLLCSSIAFLFLTPEV